MSNIFVNKIMENYFGFVYIWFDRMRKMYYVGSHLGQKDDGYIASSKWFKNAYRKRPMDFKRRILEYSTNPGMKELHLLENKWLSKIKDEELSTSKSVTERKNRYYNMKKSATGGNGDANKGNKNIGGWNRGLTKDMLLKRTAGNFMLLSDKPKTITQRINQKSKRTSKRKYKITQSIKLPKILKKDQIHIIICKECEKEISYVGYAVKNFCSKKCVAIHNGRKTTNLTRAMNGRKGAKKLSQIAKTRYRIYNNDGSWFWGYRKENGG